MKITPPNIHYAKWHVTTGAYHHRENAADGSPLLAVDYRVGTPYEHGIQSSHAMVKAIAATPQLLAALADLVASNYGQPKGVTVPALDAARAALTAAGYTITP